MRGRSRWTTVAVALFVVAGSGVLGSGCDSADGPTAADHVVYFTGNVYDGATGQRLDQAAITSISIQYRDKTLKVTIDEAGRFVSTDPLPTWQDYMVTIVADGYRPFVSRNPGFEVPASLATMNTGLADISTVQTFTFDAYLFPATLASPAATISVNILDDKGQPLGGKAAGTVRFRPTTVSSVQVKATGSRRAWANDEDLLAKTVTKTFKDGKIDVALGELSYGVTYEIAIYEVADYAPFTTDGALNVHYVAGAVTSRTISLTRSARDPLRLLMSSASSCTPPTPAATAPGAVITFTFSEDVEIVGTTYAETIDNNVSVVQSPAFGCPIKSNLDSTKQERGTKVDVAGATITLSFDPSVGLTDSMGGTVCTPSTSITSVTYSGLSLISVQPKGDPSRKVTLAQLMPNLASSVTCPAP